MVVGEGTFNGRKMVCEDTNHGGEKNACFKVVCGGALNGRKVVCEGTFNERKVVCEDTNHGGSSKKSSDEGLRLG
jgi:hypothetical protein